MVIVPGKVRQSRPPGLRGSKLVGMLVANRCTHNFDDPYVQKPSRLPCNKRGQGETNVIDGRLVDCKNKLQRPPPVYHEIIIGDSVHDTDHLCTQCLCQVVEHCRDVRMIPPQRFLKYLLRPLEQWFRLFILALEEE